MLSLIAAILLAPLSAQSPLDLKLDASDAPRRLFHARLTIPVKPGPLRLAYPKWIPGEHGPNGPIADLANLRFTANGKPIPWRRDDVNMYVVTLDIPRGVDSIEAAYDFISPPESGGFSSGSSTSSQLMVVSWNQVLLYPEGAPADQLQLQASLQVPRGWRFGTALPIAQETGDSITFKPASLNTLIDSPVSAGRFYRTINISPDSRPPHYVHLAGDSAESIDIPQSLTDSYKQLVRETGVLYGARHYREYHFLVTLSDHIAHFGLEHHESSDNRVSEDALTTDEGRKLNATLLSHEMTHSWNGKYRRPAGLATGDFEKPMKGELLWIYEGLTTYLGNILAPRSGLHTPDDYRQTLALTAASLDNRPGRKWRPLADTAIAAQFLYSTRGDYDNLRRGVDFYPEGELIWLEADVTIRTLSQNRKSLDDFVRAFFGGSNTAAEVKPYTLDDVITSLNTVQPYNWKQFFDERVYQIRDRAPLGGIHNAGWRLVYRDKPTAMQTAADSRSKSTDLRFSLGITVREDGSLGDVVIGSPADQAGLAPATRLIAVNGRQYKSAALRQAVNNAKGSGEPIDLLIRDGEYYKTYRVTCTTGERYPDLERDSAKPDLLTDIISPKADR